jgi:aldehyde dehydrogenase (NAD+)
MAPVLNVVPSESATPGPAQASPAQLRQVFEKQRETALRLRTSTAKERIAKLTKLRDAILAHEKDWYTAGYADFKKPPAEIDIAEIWPAVAECNDAIRNVAGWMKPLRVSPTLPMAGTRAYIQSEPRGRCLLISPWNYPVNLTFGPLASAIAAGNTVIIKPSEMTPHLAALMTQVVHEIFTEDEVAIFEGDASVSQALLELPFDHIFFTGSPAIGKVVMAAAAKHLTSVTLELGGKSPTIVDESADIDMAARNVLWAKYTNNGQTCIAPDHVYVHARVKDAFVARCKEVLVASYGPEGAQKDSPNLSRIVNQRHTKRIRALLDDAKARGAKALTGDVVSEDECFIAPTLLEGIPDDAKIMDEEIFGPILPIIPFTDLDDVIKRINAAPKPLALYVWSRTEAHIDKLMHQTSSGGACINHTIVQFLHMNLPFGGVNHSGIGNAHGHFGFKAFSHERGVVRTQVSLASMFFPPYTEKMQKLVKLMIRWS